MSSLFSFYGHLPPFVGPLLIIGQAITLILIFQRRRAAQSGKVRLRPAGHSALVEGLITPAIAIGFFALAFIASYSFAYDQVQHILNNTGTNAEFFDAAIASFLGLLNGIATSVSATRWRIHAMRQDPTELFFQNAAKWMFRVCFGVEALTLNYFLYRLGPSGYPDWMGQIIEFVHASMSISRGILIPLDLAFLVAFLADIIITLKDRKRAIQVYTGQRMTMMEQRLTDFDNPLKPEEAVEMISQYEALQALNEFASDAKQEEIQANLELLKKLASAKKVVLQSDLTNIVTQDALAQSNLAIQQELAQNHQALQDSLTQSHATLQEDLLNHLSATEQRMAETVGAIKQDVIAEAQQIIDNLLADMQGQMEAMSQQVAALTAGGGRVAAMTSRGVTRQQANPVQPAPGTPKFTAAMYDAARAITSSGASLSIYEIATAMSQPTEVIQAEIDRLQAARRKKMRPGVELAPDPILDVL